MPKGKKQKQQGKKPKAVKVRAKKASIYNATEPLDERGMKRAVRQAVRFEVRPILKAYGRQASELEGARERAIKKASNLGVQATGNIGAYYERLAKDEAAGIAAQRTSGAASTAGVRQAGQEVLAGIKGAGEAAQGGIGAYGGQSIAARDRLAQMIAMQQATAGRENQALTAQAQGQAAGREGLLQAMAGAAQMRGGEQISDTHRQVLNQISDIREKYGENLSKIQNAKLELLEKRPELASKILHEFRKEQQDYMLSRAALGLEKKKLGAEIKGKTGGVAYSNVNRKNELRLLRAKQKARMAEIAAVGASEAEKNAEEHRFREKELAIVGRQGGGKEGSKAGGWLPYNKVISTARRLVQHEPGHLVKGIPKTKEGKPKSGAEVRTALYDQLRANGATHKAAKRAIRQLVRSYRKKQEPGVLRYGKGGGRNAVRAGH